MTKSKFDSIVEVCSYLLFNYSIATKARDYLNQRINIELQKKFSFGYFPKQDQLKLLLSFLSKEELIENDLIYEKCVESASSVMLSPLEQHNLVMPYRDVYGTIIAIVGRSLLDDTDRSRQHISKYKNTSFEKSRNLFGLFEAKKSILDLGYVFVVEGQFDCIQAHNCGINNIVALGSSNMSLEQLILLLRYTNNIYLLLDNDEAGELGRERIIEKFGKYTNINNKLKMPLGFKDLDELLKEVKVTSSEELKDILKN
jgi:DNA primase